MCKTLSAPWFFFALACLPGCVPADADAACAGTPTPPPAAIMRPPAVPKAKNQYDIVGVNLQSGSAESESAYITFGQPFRQGEVQPETPLVAHIGGKVYAIQLDALALWPDGSVKLGAISQQIPRLCAKSTLPMMIAAAAPGDPVLPPKPVDLAKVPIDLLATLKFAKGQYHGKTVENIGNALREALKTKPSYWLRGALATQARVDIPLGAGPMHITADVTAYADQSVTADVQFNNDLTTLIAGCGSGCNPGSLAPNVYTATIALNGDEKPIGPVTQYQYQDWHRVQNSAGAPLFSMATGKSSLSLNVQHDLTYLEDAGFVLPYDLKTGVSSKNKNGDYRAILKCVAAEDFAAPLGVNCVTQYMPQTGGRLDIGYLTGWNTVWLTTGDATAAALALAQGDTGGAVPWNLRLADGFWITPAEGKVAQGKVWLDPRASTGEVTNANAIDTTDSGWTPDPAHQPELSYLPYLMTASRWNLDRLNAQAAFGNSFDWPGYRCIASTCDIILNNQDQVRYQGWSMRENELAALIDPPGSPEQAIFAHINADNWTYFSTVEATMTAEAGPMAGWIISTYQAPVTAEWQNDYLTGSAVMAAQLGDSGAAQFVGWQKDNWMSGRFIGAGMNPHDGCTYQYLPVENASLVPLKDWAKSEAALVALGESNGNGWANSQGDYCALARAVLGGALTLFPSDPSVKAALTWLNGSGAPFIDQESFQVDPTWNVVPLK